MERERKQERRKKREERVKNSTRSNTKYESEKASGDGKKEAPNRDWGRGNEADENLGGEDRDNRSCRLFEYVLSLAWQRWTNSMGQQKM